MTIEAIIEYIEQGYELHAYTKVFTGARKYTLVRLDVPLKFPHNREGVFFEKRFATGMYPGIASRPGDEHRLHGLDPVVYYKKEAAS